MLTIRTRVDHSDSYEQLFDEVYKNVTSNSGYPQRINFAIIAIIYLEYVCNLLINDVIEKKVDHTEAIKLTAALTWMDIKSKFIFVVPLLTDYKLVFDCSNQIYERLTRLITIRNQLVHNKSNYEEFGSSTSPVQVVGTINGESAALEKLSPVEIPKYYQAITDYVNSVFKGTRNGGKLSPNSFIATNNKY